MACNPVFQPETQHSSREAGGTLSQPGLESKMPACLEAL